MSHHIPDFLQFIQQFSSHYSLYCWYMNRFSEETELLFSLSAILLILSGFISRHPGQIEMSGTMTTDAVAIEDIAMTGTRSWQARMARR
ncbi:MAG: hypothetical protein P4L42_14390 [Desulfocapsaceae bacterium]|nr:hypothetical protein [Desulfocapsaceae bacterium]